MKKLITITVPLLLVISIVYAKPENITIKAPIIKPVQVISGASQPLKSKKSTTLNRDATELFFEDFESGAVGWNSIDETDVPGIWHTDYYNAYSGKSWWMGDPEIEPNGGYLDHWYQVLDTPEIHLPGSGTLTLTFYQYRAIEEPGTAPSAPNFNGWDGFNIRIRTSDKSYEDADVLTDCNPAYNSSSMYSFGFEHNEDPDGIPGIPGWGGATDGWLPTTIIIPNSYHGENVIISFAFASDPAECTTDNPSLTGVFVDNINVAGVFTNDGEDETGFNAFSNVPLGGDLWHIYEDASAPSPTHAEGCFDEATGTYNPNMENFFVSPEITLPEGVNITWDMWVKTGLDEGTFPGCDYFYVEVFYQGQWNYINNPTGNPDVNNYVFTGSVSEWTPFSQGWPGYNDISALEGETVRFKVGLHSNADTPTTIGFRIDNFTVNSELDVNPPTNLSAEYNNETGFVDLAWNKPLGLGGELQWDDGSFESSISFSSGTGYLGEEFPVGGACTIQEFTVYGGLDAGPTTLGVFEKSGGSYSTNPTYTRNIVTQAGEPATYTVNWDVQNDFIIAFECSSTIDCALDESTVPGKHSYVLSGNWVTWQEVASTQNPPLPDGEWGIRCITTYPEIEPPNNYNVYRTLISGQYPDYPIENVTDTTYIDATVESGDTYYYVVTAVYNLGESGYSNEDGAFVEIPTAEEYTYDDGTTENGYHAGASGNCLAVRITPNINQDVGFVRLIRVRFYLTSVTQPIIVQVWDDDGPDGEPGTHLLDPPFVVQASELIENSWNIITLPNSYDIKIKEGDFYIGWMEGTDACLIGLDTNGPSYDRSYQFTDETWFDYSTGVPQNFMMHAIVDTNPRLNANFIADVSYGNVPLTVNFSDLSILGTEAIIGWKWYFGDGDSSSVENPTHIYRKPENYTVSLTITDVNDSIDTETWIDYITVYPLIWPGDTDYSGIVNEEDILLIGIYWRDTGSPRSSISFEWVENDYPGGWDEPCAALADCNGDGKVDITDILAIGLNWEESHIVLSEASIVPSNLEQYRDNFVEIYNSLGKSETEVKIKNYIAKLFNLPVIKIVKNNYLGQNFPNPFSASTTISFSATDLHGLSQIKIYNIKGQLVKQFKIQNSKFKINEIEWDGKDENGKQLSNGIYLYRSVVNGKAVKTKRMLLLK